MVNLQDIEDAIENIYREAYQAYADGRLRDLPRLDPSVGVLGELWSQFDRLVSK